MRELETLANSFQDPSTFDQVLQRVTGRLPRERGVNNSNSSSHRLLDGPSCKLSVSVSPAGLGRAARRSAGAAAPRATSTADASPGTAARTHTHTPPGRTRPPRGGGREGPGGGTRVMTGRGGMNRMKSTLGGRGCRGRRLIRALQNVLHGSSSPDFELTRSWPNTFLILHIVVFSAHIFCVWSVESSWVQF